MNTPNTRRPWLILATSPAINSISVEDIPDGVIVCGVNRAHKAGVALDYQVIPFGLDPEGVDRSVPWPIVMQSSIATDEDIPIHFARSVRPNGIVLPVAPRDLFVDNCGSAGMAVQFALSRGAIEIATIGVDWNAEDLYVADEPTHFYGRNPHNGMCLPFAPPVEIAVWRSVADLVPCWNLSPFDGTQFERQVGWPRISFDDWCRRHA